MSFVQTKASISSLIGKHFKSEEEFCSLPTHKYNKIKMTRLLVSKVYNKVGRTGNHFFFLFFSVPSPFIFPFIFLWNKPFIGYWGEFDLEFLQH